MLKRRTVTELQRRAEALHRAVEERKASGRDVATIERVLADLEDRIEAKKRSAA